MADGVIFRYTKAQYQGRIDLIKGYKDQLGTHLERLETLKSQVTNFWDDPQTPEYLDHLNTQILAVRNAMDRAQEEINTQQHVIDTSVDLVAETTDRIAEIGSKILGLGIGGSGGGSK